MKRVLFLIVCAVVFVGCDKNEVSESNRPLLKDMFNGKYELISSVSEKAVDLNNDGTSSTNLLDENSMILFSSVEIRIPREDDVFLEENEFVFCEFWPTENDHRLVDREVFKVYKTRIYSGDYDIYGNILIGRFEDDLKSGTFQQTCADDGKNTLIELKSIDVIGNETIKVTAIRRLFTMNGWVTTTIESLYKRYTPIT
ncbi:MAG: hypothetical protein ACEPOZ_17600 [Marinifilaceae bacterium]